MVNSIAYFSENFINGIAKVQNEILLSESNNRTKLEKEYGKYSDAIRHTWSLQTQKQWSFYSKHWLSIYNSHEIQNV